MKPHKPKQPKKATCKNCGQEFYMKRDWQKFCTTNCRVNYHNNELLRKAKAYEKLEQSD